MVELFPHFLKRIESTSYLLYVALIQRNLGQFFTQGDVRNLWPHTYTTREGQESESSIYMQDLTVRFRVQSSPLWVFEFYRRPFDPTGNLNPKLHAVSMTT